MESSLVAALVPLVLVALVALFGWLDAPRAARRRANRLTTSTDLTLDEDMRAMVLRRLRRRQRATMTGMAGGGLAGFLLTVLQAGGTGFGVSGWWVACLLVGTGSGALGVHVADSLAASAEPGPRAAVLRRRRLRDFMLPVELGAPIAALVLPVLAFALAAAGPGSTQERQLVVAVSCVAVLVTGATMIAQRFVLHIAPPADSPARLKWEDALRGIALRDLGATAYGTSLACGGVGALQLVTDVLSRSSAATTMIYVVVWAFCAGMIALVIMAENLRAPSRRFLRLYDDAPVGGQR